MILRRSLFALAAAAVNPQGQLVYAGGIDSIASSDPDDIRRAA